MPYVDRTSATSARASEWDRRIQRAAELAGTMPAAAEILLFYRRVLEFQRTVYNDASLQTVPAIEKGTPLREHLDLTLACRHLPELMRLAEEHGTASLAQKARELRATPQEQQREMLQAFRSSPEADPYSFFARVLLQPCAERLARNYPPQPPGPGGFRCPLCGARPQAAVLRPEGEGGKRFLLCSFCLTEWEFRRVLCPTCGEEDYQKLPRYSAEQVDAVRVEACDTCHFYLKSVDLTANGLAVPVVDEVATVPLDIWGAEHGYKKVQPNIMGL